MNAPSHRISIAVSAAVVVLVASIGGLAWQQKRCSPLEPAVTTVWTDVALDAIRTEFPAPTVHSRNLYHLSAAMWDVWAAYEPAASGVFVNEDRSNGDDIEKARFEAISFAAHRLLDGRYVINSSDAARLTEFDATLASLCLDPSRREDPDSPAAFGVTVANTILDAARDDGSLESARYLDPTYEPVNPPLVVDEPGTTMTDPNRWQPLELTERVSRNGQPLENIQEYIGPNWGFVTPFAIEGDPEQGLPVDPGSPPLLQTDRDEFVEAATEIVVLSSRLDPWSSATIDISPSTVGNVALGGYEAEGRLTNPATGEPYEPNVVPEADFGRVIAEYWADGPDSETPPGHWNTLAIDVGDALERDGALTIDGRPVERIEWDVKMGLALNGALHDAAIAVWGTKAHYDYSRPISMIRYLGGRGELIETPGVIETITPESSSPGERHVHLADYVGEQAVNAWLGEPLFPESMLGGVAWTLAVNWLPYQRASFVSPAFAAYVSGHSGFSRAAAEVLTELTGSEFFPGGMATHTVEPGGLLHESGPTQTVTLQWATYRDAADQAGLSRLWGGIHVWADDLAGRQMGAEIGVTATDHARTFFGT